MSMRFRKQINVGNGVKLNINKHSVGVTGGVKGAHITTNSSGNVTKSAGIPGTGISFRSSSKASGSSGHPIVKFLVIICIAAIIILYAWIPVAIVGIVYLIYCLATKATVNKKYVILGALIFAVSISAFIYTNISNGRAPMSFDTTPASTTSSSSLT